MLRDLVAKAFLLFDSAIDFSSYESLHSLSQGPSLVQVLTFCFVDLLTQTHTYMSTWVYFLARVSTLILSLTSITVLLLTLRLKTLESRLCSLIWLDSSRDWNIWMLEHENRKRDNLTPHLASIHHVYAVLISRENEWNSKISCIATASILLLFLFWLLTLSRRKSFRRNYKRWANWQMVGQRLTGDGPIIEGSQPRTRERPGHRPRPASGDTGYLTQVTCEGNLTQVTCVSWFSASVTSRPDQKDRGQLAWIKVSQLANLGFKEAKSE